MAEMTEHNYVCKMTNIQSAIQQFGFDAAATNVMQIGNGLIHQTYKLQQAGKQPVILQQINQHIFQHPEWLQENYLSVQNCLSATGEMQIPLIIQTIDGKNNWKDADGNAWRAFEYIPSATIEAGIKNYALAGKAANCFARFTAALKSLSAKDLKLPIPHFHDVSYRYQQMEEAILKAPIFPLMRATHVIAELRQRKKYVQIFESFSNENNFPARVMHHDCKLNNILFDEKTGEPICPIDLDTVMPGKFFSDLGDMIRTMACTENEESRAWEKITIDKAAYQAIIDGYLNGIGHQLTEAEKAHIHYSGLLLTYMQTLRFVTDFLNGDVYYTTHYPEQNLNRALNQLILLEQLEIFIEQ